MKSRSLFGLVLIVALLAMFGCGGGDGAPAAPAPTAVVKIATTNTAPTLVNGVNAMLNYSSSKYSLPPNSVDGFNPKVIASGNGLVANTLVFGHLSSAGHVRIGLISAAGITGGEFATATFTILPGKTAAPGDFTIALPFAADEGVIDLSGAPIVGSSVTATRQP